MAAATDRTSVDLPMPGSPPSSTTLPGTRPPPRTRSTSRDTHRNAVGLHRGDLAEGDQRRRRDGCARAGGGAAPAAGRMPRGNDSLNERVPAAARAALAFPAKALRAARAADVAALGPRHGGPAWARRRPRPGSSPLPPRWSGRHPPTCRRAPSCPDEKRPIRSASASWSSTMFWMTRRNGRAP